MTAAPGRNEAGSGATGTGAPPAPPAFGRASRDPRGRCRVQRPAPPGGSAHAVVAARWSRGLAWLDHGIRETRNTGRRREALASAGRGRLGVRWARWARRARLVGRPGMVGYIRIVRDVVRIVDVVIQVVLEAFVIEVGEW